ncbi:MAG: hypothetical protein R3C17_14095 [Planctomycetaceae bacterium]
MAIFWTQVLYSGTNVLHPDLYDALRCLGDVSRDIRDHFTPTMLNTRIGQTHSGDGSLMCELWVYRNIDPGVPTLALALDRSLKRLDPLDRSTPATRDRWIVTLGIRHNSGLGANRIKNIVKDKLKAEQKTGKAFSLLWHARKATAQQEYDPDGSEVDAVFRELLDQETDATVKLTEPKPLQQPGMANVITRADLKNNGRPSEAAYAHFDDFLKKTGRVQELRVIDFEIQP